MHSISDLARRFGLPESTARFYCKRFRDFLPHAGEGKRRRYLRDINSNNAVVRGFAERNAINAPIQGSSADMIKIAMIRIQQEFEKLKLRSRMIMQVHDELVFDVHQDELETVQPVIYLQMRNAIELSIPVEVEMSHGNNWLEAH